MAEQDVERTEQPTPKRRREAQREGQIAISVDVSTTVNLMAVTLVLMWIGPGLAQHARLVISRLWAPRSDIDLGSAVSLLKEAASAAAPVMVPVLTAAAVAGVIAGLAQTRGALTIRKARPKFSKLNPIKGFSRVIKKDAPIELVKSLLKIAIAVGAIWFAVSGNIEEYLGLPHLPLFRSGGFQLSMALRALLAGTIAMIAVAAIDYAWKHYQNEKQLKMSRSEVKDEMKQSQGDPQVRGKIAGLMFERGLKRMMGEVPQADVVVTNPEHISIALKYERAEMAAPRVLAKGAGFVALRIREIARESGVPIVENRPLARALYRSVKVGQSVPEQLFQAVAEVLAYVYRLDRARGRAW